VRAVSAIVAVAALLVGCGGRHREPAHQHFVSRPDLKPPIVRILHHAGRPAPGYIFIAPKKNVAQAGPLILDNRGEVVWFDPLPSRGVTDFRVQRYHGRPVLTWWRGKPKGRPGAGGYAIFDDHYRRLASIRPGHGLVGDIHEFQLTPRGTALLTIFHRIRLAGHDIFEGVVQELDVATGRVAFEWHSIDHVAVAESYEERPQKRSTPYDYFHINSIDVDTDGNLLVSARNTHAVYKIDRRTGRVLWRLGGKRSDFTFGPGARFAWQHDARRLANGDLSLFDNEAAPQSGPQSRGIVLRLDMTRMHATLVAQFVHRPPLLAVDQGNMQHLPGGHFLVGWGHQPYFTEYTAGGRVVLDARFNEGADSYRAYRFTWSGHAPGRPALGVAGKAAFASWNGATAVYRWELLAGSTARVFRAVRSVRRAGFETRIPYPNGASYIRVRALSADGSVLGTSAARALH
jgi:hypothetical protein